MSDFKLLQGARLLLISGLGLVCSLASAESNISISGWLNESMIYYDDGVQSDIVQASDNGTTLGSRINLSGSTDIANGWTAGFEVILEPQADETPLIEATQHPYSTGGPRFDSSNGHSIDVLGNSVYIAGMLGKLTFGLQSMPTDNIAVLGDPSLTLWSGISPVFRGNGFALRSGNTSRAGSGISYNDLPLLVWGDFLGCLTAGGLQGAGGIGLDCNGIYRQGVRYDLPQLYEGLSIAFSYANDDVYDVAAKLNGAFGRLGYTLHVGYAINKAGSTREIGLDGSGLGVYSGHGYGEASNLQIQLGLMDSVSGLFATVSYQHESADDLLLGDTTASYTQERGYGDDTNAYYIKAGVKRAFTSLGPTAIYGEYGSYNDQYGAWGVFGVTGSEVQRIGVSIDQYFGDRFILYGKYEHLSLDVDIESGSTSTSIEDYLMGVAGEAEDLSLFIAGMVFFF